MIVDELSTGKTCPRPDPGVQTSKRKRAEKKQPGRESKNGRTEPGTSGAQANKRRRTETKEATRKPKGRTRSGM